MSWGFLVCLKPDGTSCLDQPQSFGSHDNLQVPPTSTSAFSELLPPPPLCQGPRRRTPLTSSLLLGALQLTTHPRIYYLIYSSPQPCQIALAISSISQMGKPKAQRWGDLPSQPSVVSAGLKPRFYTFVPHVGPTIASVPHPSDHLLT